MSDKMSEEERERLRASGLRPVEIWIADTTKPGFAEEAARQSRLLGDSDEEWCANVPPEARVEVNYSELAEAVSAAIAKAGTETLGRREVMRLLVTQMRKHGIAVIGVYRELAKAEGAKPDK